MRRVTRRQPISITASRRAPPILGAPRLPPSTATRPPRGWRRSETSVRPQPQLDRSATHQRTQHHRLGRLGCPSSRVASRSSGPAADARSSSSSTGRASSPIAHLSAEDPVARRSSPRAWVSTAQSSQIGVGIQELRLPGLRYVPAVLSRTPATSAGVRYGTDVRVNGVGHPHLGHRHPSESCSAVRRSGLHLLRPGATSATRDARNRPLRLGSGTNDVTVRGSDGLRFVSLVLGDTGDLVTGKEPVTNPAYPRRDSGGWVGGPGS